MEGGETFGFSSASLQETRLALDIGGEIRGPENDSFGISAGRNEIGGRRLSFHLTDFLPVLSLKASTEGGVFSSK